MKKSIIAIAIATLASSAVMANPTVSTTMSGTIDVGTFVAAGPGQYVEQTVTGGASGFTVVGNGLASWKPYSVTEGGITTQIPGANCVQTALVASSITGVASESHSGNGLVGSLWTVNGAPVNAIVSVADHTNINGLTVPVTQLAPLKCDTCGI